MSDKPKWTPGPWEALPNVTQYGRVVAYGHWLADCKPEDRHLIAAAPDLYETLAEIVRVEEGPGETDRPHMIRARAALNKARGQ